MGVVVGAMGVGVVVGAESALRVHMHHCYSREYINHQLTRYRSKHSLNL